MIRRRGIVQPGQGYVVDTPEVAKDIHQGVVISQRVAAVLLLLAVLAMASWSHV